MADHAIGLVPIHPERVSHFCNDMTREVHVGDSAYMSIVNPWDDSGIEWQLRYGRSDAVRYCAASVIASYDYLLSSEITLAEATRRLRILRQARRQLRPSPGAADE